MELGVWGVPEKYIYLEKVECYRAFGNFAQAYLLFLEGMQFEVTLQLAVPSAHFLQRSFGSSVKSNLILVNLNYGTTDTPSTDT